MRSVEQTLPANRLELNDDGTPRRRYDREETSDSRIVVKSVIGLVIANALILVKNVLFGNEQTQAAAPAVKQPKPEASAAVDKDQLPPLEQGDGGDRPGSATDAAELEPSPVGSGTYFAAFAPPVNIEPELAPIRYRGSGRIANDNEQLYGASPGNGIGLSGDSFNAGGGAGGSGAGGGGSDDGGHQSGDDDDEDNDDEEESHGGPGGGGNSGDPDGPRHNRLPTVLAAVVLGSLAANEARAISSAELLRDASDADGDTLTIRDLRASSGTLAQNPNGGWVFTPDADDTSAVTFSYLVSDGRATVAQTASLDLVPRPAAGPMIGSDGDDTLFGTPDDDVMEGRGGNDTIDGSAGDDVIYGGAGDDRIIAGDGDDVVYAGTGNDVVFAGSGDDFVDAGEGDDFVDGGSGDDTIVAAAGSDTVLAGSGDDVVDGGDGDDTLYGQADDDLLLGGAGDDSIDGGEGDDVATGGSGTDVASLGAGNDTILAELSDGNDSYDGGDGSDTYDMSATSSDTTVDLAAGTATSADIGTDTVHGVENVSMGSGHDTVTGSDDDNVVTGGAGSDTVELGGGDDTVVAKDGDGNDAYDGGEDTDTYDMSGTSADATVDLAAGTATSADTGTDTLANIENASTGAGNDTVTGSEAANSIDAGAGSDVATLGGGDDTVTAQAGDGDDTYAGGSGSDTYDLSTTSADALIDLISERVTSADVGSDIVIEFENVRSGRGNDRIIASDSTNVLIGGEGDDRFEFHSSSGIGNGRGYRDKILDFESGDRIDIDRVRDEFAESLEENLEDSDIQNFVILSDLAEFSRPGELKVKYETFGGEDYTLLQGNIDYNSDVDFELELAGHYVLTEDDFYRV